MAPVSLQLLRRMVPSLGPSVSLFQLGMLGLFPQSRYVEMVDGMVELRTVPMRDPWEMA